MNFGLNSVFVKQPVLSRIKINLPFIQTKRRHMKSYLCILTCFKRVAHVEKSVLMQRHFEQFVGKQIRQEGKYLGISEAEPLRFDCVNQLSNKDSAGHSSVWF